MSGRFGHPTTVVPKLKVLDLSFTKAMRKELFFLLDNFIRKSMEIDGRDFP